MDVPQVDRGVVPGARVIRRYTARVGEARQGLGRWRVLTEIWSVAVLVAVALGVVLGVAWTLDLQPAGLAAPGTGLASGEAGVLAALVMLAGALLGTAARLGPVGVGSGGATWWLPLPVDRRELLRSSVLVWPAIGAATGLVVVPFAPLLLGVEPTVGVLVRWGAVGAGVGATVLALAVAAQLGVGRTRHAPAGAVDGSPASGVRPRERHDGDRTDHPGTDQPHADQPCADQPSTTGRPRRPGVAPRAGLDAVGDALLLAGVLGLAVLVVLAPQGVAWSLGDAWWAGPVLLVGAALVTALAERRSGALSGARLREHGAAADRAVVAVLSLDVRELGHALAGRSRRARHRSVTWAPRGPRRVLVLADALLLVRSPRLLVQVAVAVVLVLALGTVPLLASGAGLYALMLVTGLWAARAAAAGARHADLVPAVDRLLPLSPRWVRLSRGALPAAAAVVWMGATTGGVLMRASDGVPGGAAAWTTVCLTWVAVLAAAAVRAAYRAPFKVRAAVSTPMGGVPQTAGLGRGLDVALLGTAPTALALVTDAWPPALLVIQGVLALGVVTWVVLVRDEPTP